MVFEIYYTFAIYKIKVVIEIGKNSAIFFRSFLADSRWTDSYSSTRIEIIWV